MLHMAQICFYGKILGISRGSKRGFWKFWFFGDFWILKVRIFTIFVIFDQKLNFKLPKIAKKSKFSKSPLWSPRYCPNLATKPNLGHLERLLLRKMHTKISKSRFFGRFFIEIREIARVVVNFDMSLHNVKIFFNSVKNFWPCITQITKYV